MANFCGKCGSRLDLDTGCCSNPQCEDYREPKKKRIPRRLVILPILTLLMLLGLIWELCYFDLIEVPFFQCRHEWEDANCTEAKNCLKCEETEGIALGHTPGKTETTYDIVDCEAVRKTLCDRCKQCIYSESSPLETFSVNKLFVFSPEEFMNRMTSIVKHTYPKFCYEIDNTQEFLYVHLYFDDSDTSEYLLEFFDAESQPFNNEEFQKAGIWCVCLQRLSPIEKDTEYKPIDPAVLEVFSQSCDPIMTEEDLYTLQLMQMTTFANWLDFEEQSGTYEKNELFYEFSYRILDLLEEKGYYLDASSIMIYADNWMY